MEVVSISSVEYEIPQIFLDADYIPTDRVWIGRNFPRFLRIDNKLWVANVRDGYPFYERYRKGKKK